MSKKNNSKQKAQDKQPAKMGRPSEYRPEFCQLLIEHMRQGNSFESFGAVVMKGKTTLYNWLAEFPDFVNAKSTGTQLSLKFYEDMGRAIATGQLRRLKSERPALDAAGNPIRDKDGNVVMHREYEPATAGQAVWIFMMKNMHRWTDRQDILMGGSPGAAPIPLKVDLEQKYAAMTPEEVKKRFNELMAEAKAEGLK